MSKLVRSWRTESLGQMFGQQHVAFEVTNCLERSLKALERSDA
jgi:hypothetical protein